MLDNMKHVFKVFEEITGCKANRIKTHVIYPTGKMWDTITASYWLLDNIDEVKDYIFDNNKVSNSSAIFTFEDYYHVFINFDYDEDAKDIPTYFLLVEYIDYDRDLDVDEEVEEMYRICRKEGYIGHWRECTY